ncbi:MAG: DUF4399 domain-containing protein [Gemmatimonadota bacterium]
MSLTLMSLTATAFLVACGGTDAPPATDMAESPAPTEAATQVWFESPVDGEVVEGPDVLVRFGHSGIELVPPDEPRPGEGHHHIFVNVDVTPMGQVIPAGREGIIHMGDASSEYLLEGLEPGAYRLITVMADGLHIPLDPPVVDTVNITVVEPQ